MLVIRMQRTGRKGSPQYRMVVQDSRKSPTSGKVVARLGSYNPHTKEANFDVEQAKTFMNNGAQPSDRVARLLQKEGVKLPDWVTLSADGKREIRNPEKLRRNQPAEEAPAEEAPAAESADAPADAEAPAPEEETPAESTEEAKPEAEDAPAEEPKAEESTEDTPAEDESKEPSA